MPQPKVVIFTCNWNSYSGLETAGAGRLAYPAGTRPLKVMCLGQIDPGLILKAFEKGADGVLLLGCPPGECHYEFGNRCAEGAFEQARRLASLMGVDDGQLRLDSIPSGEGAGEAFVEKVNAFRTGLERRRAK